jgi:hypothetical protein
MRRQMEMVWSRTVGRWLVEIQSLKWCVRGRWRGCLLASDEIRERVVNVITQDGAESVEEAGFAVATFAIQKEDGSLLQAGGKAVTYSALQVVLKIGVLTDSGGWSGAGRRSGERCRCRRTPGRSGERAL